MSFCVAPGFPDGWLCTRMTAPALVIAAVLIRSWRSNPTESRVPNPISLSAIKRFELLRNTAYKCSFCLYFRDSYRRFTSWRVWMVSGSSSCISTLTVRFPSSFFTIDALGLLRWVLQVFDWLAGQVVVSVLWQIQRLWLCSSRLLCLSGSWCCIRRGLDGSSWLFLMCSPGILRCGRKAWCGRVCTGFEVFPVVCCLCFPTKPITLSYILSTIFKKYLTLWRM